MKLQSKILTLSEGWKIVLDKDNVGKNEKWYKTGIPLENAKDAVVPSYAHLYFEDPRGICWYELNFRNDLYVTENDLYILKFAMAEYRKELYVNGKYVGEHVGIEDPFEFDVTKFMKRGNNRITVRVSKPYTQDVDGYHFYSIPHRNELPVGLRPGQCYNAMGLHGQIDLVVTPKLYVDDSFIFANTETGNVEIKYTVVNAFDRDIEGTILTECSVKRTGEFVNADKYTRTFKPGTTTFTRKVKIDNFLWWDINDPNLYNVNMCLSTELGEHKTYKHTGFRTFVVGDDGYYYLNGRRIFLRSSHTGNCMPESFHHLAKKKELLRKDFYMAKAAGFNMVRFISGAGLPEQLDYCDELGLMIYEEPIASWNLHDYKDQDPIGVYRHDLLTMMKRDRSHPCLTIIGFLNETPSHRIKGPFGNVYMYARHSLKAARKVDPTRLILYSSGRWDGPHSSRDQADPWCGSVSNPFTNKWQCLWCEESDEPDYYAKKRKELGLPETWRITGDIHHYPAGPIKKFDEARMRDVGSFTKRPVFYSELGTGSMLNVVWLKRKFEEMNAMAIAPDVKIVNRMYDEFVRDLKRFGFENEYPSLLELFRTSEKLNNRQRSYEFSILRSNPHTNGVSLTGLLDHSVCGEGFFTFMREYKPGMADTLQNGFAPVKWCIFMNDTHAYRGRPFTVEAVLANEDVLGVGTYPVSFNILARDGSAVYSENFTFEITEEDTKYFSVPVYKKDITLDVPTGEYEVVFELMKGAGATDGNLKFYVTDASEIKASAKSVVGVALNDTTKAFLEEKGVKVTDLASAKAKSVILVGEIPKEEREETWKKLTKKAQSGARIVVLSEYSLIKGEDLDVEDRCYYLPVEKKPVSWPAAREATADWLYHKEYLLKRNHPYFEGLPTGMMDLDYYTYVITGHVFDYISCDVVPDEIAAISMSAGLPWGLSKRDEIQENGVNIGTYNVGKGAVTINTFGIETMINKNPAADRLLINIINEEARRAK